MAGPIDTAELIKEGASYISQNAEHLEQGRKNDYLYT